MGTFEISIIRGAFILKPADKKSLLKKIRFVLHGLNAIMAWREQAR
jgi:hypothetical protein